ncbi:hypothetical protein DAMA08_021820 [Martiniozyma asiatica (nom. inval.)]|nr:hypothetical protein DAMA08_021820 [Martiniozyma asiatica]
MSDNDFIEPDVQPSTIKATSKPSELQFVAPEPFNQASSFLTTFPIPELQTQERPFSGGNTLDESVWTTLHRDASTIFDKTLSILWPLRLQRVFRELSQSDDTIEPDVSDDTIRKVRDWDLWGPLVINLAFSLIISYLQKANPDDGDVFSSAFTLIWAAVSVLAVNVMLMTGGLGFLQSVSLLSYTFFPIVFGGGFCLLIKWKWLRLIVMAIVWAWGFLCSWLVLRIVAIEKHRVALMVAPVGLVWGIFAWYCVIVN